MAKTTEASRLAALEYGVEYRNKNRAILAKRAGEYYYENRERCLAARRKRDTGFTKEMFSEQLARQKGKCAICEITMDKPHADHDHATGFQRGIVCSNCNTGLGLFKDNPLILRAAAKYLDFYKSLSRMIA